MLRSLSLISLPFVSVLFALVSGIAPAAAGFDEDQKLCNTSGTKPDIGIAACTRQISSGRWKGHNLAISYYNRGIFWYDKNENDRALADYTKAIELSPDYSNAFNNRGLVWSAKGNLDRAIADYDRAIQIDGKDPFRWNNRGLAWKRKGDYDRAIADFEQAIRVDSGYTAAYTNRGEAYEGKGDTARARADYGQALRVPQKYGNGKWAHDKARERLAALGSAPASAPPRVASTTFEQDQKVCNSSDTKPDVGIPACTRQITSGRWEGHNLAISYYNRGIFYYDKDELDRAIADYGKALELSSEYASAYNNRGNAWSAKGDLDRALADYDRAIQIDGNDPFRFNNRGLIWRRKGNHDLAIADFDRAIKVDPGYTAAYTNRGVTYEAKGDIARARADFRAALALPQKYGNGKYAHDKASERLAALASSDDTRFATAAGTPPTRPAAAPTPAPAPVVMGRRVALVIGNSAYSAVGALPNPRRDAEAIASALRRTGFEVTQEIDLSKEKLERTLRDFARKTEAADWALVYFAGHGIEVNGTNYLIPIDAKLEVDKDVDFEAVPLSKVMTVVDGAKRMRLVLLDACRDNPFARTIKRSIASRSIGRGLAKVEPEPGTLVVYAAKHGEVALDGDRDNSPFAKALMQNMMTPGLEIRRLFDLVRDDVVEMTSGRQQPFHYGSVPGRADFYFVSR